MSLAHDLPPPQPRSHAMDPCYASDLRVHMLPAFPEAALSWRKAHCLILGFRSRACALGAPRLPCSLVDFDMLVICLVAWLTLTILVTIRAHTCSFPSPMQRWPWKKLSTCFCGPCGTLYHTQSLAVPMRGPLPRKAKLCRSVLKSAGISNA